MRNLLALAIGLALPALAAGDVLGLSTGLLGEWTFNAGNARDSSGRGADGVVHGVKFEDGAAVFDGKSHLELPVAAAELLRKYRRIEVEVRARFDRPGYYYNTLLSHPFVQVGVHSLGSGKGRPCYSLSTVESDLGPSPGEGKADPRWGKAPRLTADSKERFYYWGWVGDGSTTVDPGSWVTLRTLYDGTRVTQHLDGKLVGTHPVRAPGTKVGACEGAAAKAYLGRALSDTDSEHLFIGRIDHVRIRGSR